MPGAPDDEISVDIDSLEKMVRNVRHSEAAMGQGINFVAASREGRVDDGSWTRHKILAAGRDIQKGVVIKKEDIAAKRPGNRERYASLDVEVDSWRAGEVGDIGKRSIKPEYV